MTGSSPATLLLERDALRVELRPDLGGCLAGVWHRDQPVLRSAPAAGLTMARLSACYPLLPYSNRVGHARFSWQGTGYTLRPNFDPEPHAVHGVGWQRPWRVLSHSAQQAELALSHAPDADWPFPFEARQTVTLDADTLELRLELINSGASAAPAGLGWHPYFPKRERSRLHFEAAGRWDMGPDKLPAQRGPTRGVDADIAFLELDHCFDGWAGPVRIRDERFSLRLSSSLTRLVVFTPPDRDYFAVEPVSHVNNALNQADPLALGVCALAPGQSISAWMRLEIGEAR